MDINQQQQNITMREMMNFVTEGDWHNSNRQEHLLGPCHVHRLQQHMSVVSGAHSFHCCQQQQLSKLKPTVVQDCTFPLSRVFMCQQFLQSY